VNAPDLVALARAYDYAATAHAGEQRKGLTDEPYVNHLTEVAALAAEATQGRDAALVIAAVLHDAVEKTGAQDADIRSRFGDEVADLVAELTEDKSLPEDERKRRQVEEMAGKSARAQILKIADKTSNLRGLAEGPPEEWPEGGLDAYVDWVVEVVDKARGVCPPLEAKFDSAVAQAREAAKRRRQGG